MRRSAFQEAIAHLGKAIAMADKAAAGKPTSETGKRPQSGPDIRAKFAQAVLITQGHTAAATKAAFDGVEVTISVRREETEQVTAFYGRWTQALMSGQLPAALAVAEGGMRDGEVLNRKMLVAEAHRLISSTNFYLGSFAATRGHAERALTLYDERWAEAHRVAICADFLCGAYSFLAVGLAALGEVECAARHMALALQRAHELGQPFSVANAYAQDLQRLWLTNCPKETLQIAEALSAIVCAKGIGAWDLHARMFGSWASGRLSNPAAGAQAVREAWGHAQQSGARLYDTAALRMLADLATSAGAVEEALSCVAQGLEIVVAQGTAFALAPLHRIRGEALALRDAVGAEESSLRINPHRARAMRALVSAASRPATREALSIDRPPRRSPRRTRAGARRLLADPGNVGDRRG